MKMFTFAFRLHTGGPDCLVRVRSEDQGAAYMVACRYAFLAWGERWNPLAGIWIKRVENV